jgi:hypothetical protein
MNNFLKIQRTKFDAKTIAFLLIGFIIFTYQTSAQNLGLDAGFNAEVTDSSVINYVSTTQPDGKILVGGGYSFVNGAQRRGLVRLNADGTLDSAFNPGGSGPNGDVL